MSEVEQLRNEIKRLKAELAEREADLGHFRSEMEGANRILEGMIAELHRDIKSLVKLQRALVPTEYPQIQGFHFSTKFVPSKVSGGDYLDIFQHDNRMRFGIIMSSASNYGMSAQLLSAFLNYTGQMEARKGADPALMAKKVIDEALVDAEPGDHADLFYSYVDMKKIELHYSLSGDLLAFVLRRGQSEVECLESTDDPVSHHQNFSGHKKVVSFDPKDRLVLCSRGIVESKNIEDEPFGLHRLLSAIKLGDGRSVHELRNEVLFQVEQFSQGVESQRDKSIVVGEVQERVLKLAST